MSCSVCVEYLSCSVCVEYLCHVLFVLSIYVMFCLC